MTKGKTSGIAVLNHSDIPRGWVPMADYKRRGENVYERVKVAASDGRIESYCLFENGRMRRSPRRWVNPTEVEAVVFADSGNESPLFAERSQSPQPPAPTPVESASVAALVEAVRMLTLEIEAAAALVVEALARSQPESEPVTFGDS